MITTDFLEKTIPYLEDPKFGFVYTAAEIGSVPGEGILHYSKGQASNIISSQVFILEAIHSDPIVPYSPGAGLFRLEDIRENLQLAISSPNASSLLEHGAGIDLLLYLFTAHQYPFVAHIPEPLAFFRAHQSSITIQYLNNNPVRFKSYHEQAKEIFTNFTNFNINWQQHLNKNSKIKVSAIVSTYNSSYFIRGCLQNLIGQSLYSKGELEIIVIDSNSNENEKLIVKDFLVKYSNIFYVRTLNKETIYAAWNRGIQATRGLYITNANTDDLHRPDALERMADYLDKNPQVALVYADQLITNVANDKWSTTQANMCWNWPPFSYSELEQRCIIGPQPMWRKSLHEKYGYFRSEFTSAGDYEFWLRIGKAENFVRLPEILGLYYYNTQGLEHASSTSQQETYRIWNEYGIAQRGVIPKNSVPVPISPLELNALPYRTANPIATNLGLETQALTKALVSVIIPCYNHATFLPEAVESIINQTYENWECIIVNDGSTDKTSEVARYLIENYKTKRIRILKKPNSGVVDSRNWGIQSSSGQFILLLDADDKIHYNFLEEAIKCLQNRRDVGFVYTDIQYFGNRNDQISYGDFSASSFLINNQASITSLFRREIYNQVGGFKKVMEDGLEDWEFWISAYQNGWQGYRLGKAYLYYRQHATGSRLQNLVSNSSKLEVQRAKIIILHPKLYSNEAVSWANEILGNRGILLDNKIVDSNLVLDYDPFFAELSRQVYQYQQVTTEPSVLANLRRSRKEVADQWLNLQEDQLEKAYLEEVGKRHKILLNSGFRDEPLIEEEKKFITELKCYLSEGFDQPKALQYILAAMLYCRADQLPLQQDFDRIPPWLLNDYLTFLFAPPPNFQEVGEADNYYHYMQGWIDYLHASILSEPDSLLWHEVVTQFVPIANFIPLYFNEINLKDIYVKRAEIIEFFFKIQGYEVDYEFADRSVTRKKIRLGILAAHFTPTAETFATLSAFEYISRDFEVILYPLTWTNNSLEQYCQSCANSVKLLPKDLVDQVNYIRADDLDLLLIATNVTAVTNQICLLSLHRLARVQVTSVSSVVTTGMRHVDYYISGQLTDALITAEEHYIEKLVKLEGTAQCFSYGHQQQQVNIKVDRESLGISEETVVFTSGANFFKITPELIDTWAKIIAAVPNSVLLLLPFGPNWSNAYPKKAFFKQINTKFEAHGLTADCVMILDPQPVPNLEEVKEYFKIADIYLDSYPFSGTSSLIEPLDVGLPIIARQGSCFRSAMGAAILQALGVPDLVADSEESYIQSAIALGKNPELRKDKSKQIQQKMQRNPSFLDSRAYSAQMGSLFQELFGKYLAETLSNNLNFREINLIIFPDWNQPEELLCQNLASVISAIASHPQKNQITLLIDTSNLADPDYANLALSSVAMNLLMEEDVDVTEELEISLLENLGQLEWQALLTKAYGRVALEQENHSAIAQVGAENIPVVELNSLNI